MIRSPGSSVIACEMNATTSATPKIWFDVFESCIVSPFRIARIGSACGSGTSLAGTRSPIGRKVSSDFRHPLAVGKLDVAARDVVRHDVAAHEIEGVVDATPLARRPITTPSSAS